MPDVATTPDVRSIPTRRLTLEPQVPAHAEAMFALLQDPAIYAYENEPPASLAALRERFVRLESRRSADGRALWLNWVLRLPTGELAGFVQATVHDDATAGIAYVLASRFWGRGLAGEAVRGMLRELANYYNVSTVSAVLKRANARSVRLLERLGFELVSTDMQALAGVETDEILMRRATTREVPSMSESQNIAIARRWFDEVWNGRRDETVHELLHPDAIGHLEGLVTRGVAEFFRARAFLTDAFPDLHVSVEDAIAQGDRVAIRWSVQATHRGELLGIRATGTTVDIRGITWLRFADGRIVEGWDAWNQGRLMMDLQAAADGRLPTSARSVADVP